MRSLSGETPVGIFLAGAGCCRHLGIAVLLDSARIVGERTTHPANQAFWQFCVQCQGIAWPHWWKLRINTRHLSLRAKTSYSAATTMAQLPAHDTTARPEDPKQKRLKQCAWY
jgi:hypothetical protein